MSDSKKILVVEGNASLGKMIQSGLEKAGYTVTSVDSGRDAWDQIGGGYDVLVTDYGMSDSVGTKICEGIRQHRKHKGMPMVVLSGERSVDLAQLQSDLKLVAAFKKPLSVNELVDAINGHFGLGEAPVPAAEPAPEPAAEEPAPEPVAEEAPAEEPAAEPPAEEPAAEAPAAPAEEVPTPDAPPADAPADAEPEKSE